MADILDELIGLKKEFKAMSDGIAADSADLIGAPRDSSAEPVWAPGDYKVVPKGNVAMCARCKSPEAACDMCVSICPVDAIEFDDDGSIEIGPACRKCGLCVAACPTDAMVSSMHAPKQLYDKIVKAAMTNEMCYITCTRALGHVPHDAVVVVPCVGAISPEVWYAVLCEYGNIGVYLPAGICSKCRTTTGEEAYTDAITVAESWSGENVDLVERERDMVLEVDHQYERDNFVKDSMKSLGMGAANLNPLTRKMAQAAETLSKHSKQITEMTKSVERLVGCKNVEEKKRVLTYTRQLMMVALANHPKTAANILLDMPVLVDACDSCGKCAELCPTAAIDMIDGIPVVMSTHCVTCGLCVDACTKEALGWEEVSGQRLILDDPEARQKVEDDEKREKREAEALEKSKDKLKKALDMIEAQAD